jgi:hypothetical protein
MDVHCENVTQLLLLKYHWELKYFVIKDEPDRPSSSRHQRVIRGKLQTGNVLAIEFPNPPAAQQYNPATGAWTAIGNTPVFLVDPCGNNQTGPAVTRPRRERGRVRGQYRMDILTGQSHGDLYTLHQHLGSGPRSGAAACP